MMRILIADFDLFSATGGGQTIYRSLIRRNPGIHFYYYRTRGTATGSLPPNVTPISYAPRYNSPYIGFDVGDLCEAGAKVLARNLAYAARGQSFDVVDVPDYHQFLPYLRPAFAEFGVQAGCVALALHGRISITMGLGWNVPRPMDQVAYPTGELQDHEQCHTELFEHIRQLEDDAFRAADIRYAISPWYARLLSTLHDGLSCTVLDPLTVLDIPPLPEIASTVIRPTLLCAGRLERTKSPDFFLDLVWFASAHHHADVMLVGGDDIDHGQPMSQRLLQQARLRNVPLQYRPSLPYEELMRLLAAPVMVLAPSRFDSFNLVALEGLLRGALVGLTPQTGIYHYLREQFPELAFCHLNLHNLTASARALQEYLHHFAAIRDHNMAYVQSLRLGERYHVDALLNGMDAVYRQPSQCRAETQALYTERYQNTGTTGTLFTGNTVKTALKRYLPAPWINHLRGAVYQMRRRQRNMQQRMKSLYARNSLLTRIPIMHALACHVATQSRRGQDARAQQAYVAGITRLGRLRHFRALAAEARERKNPLLAIIYRNRLVRWSGQATEIDMPSATATLIDQQYPDVAAILPWVTGAEADADARIVDYLNARTRHDYSPDPAVPLTVRKKHTNPHPRVSILVSLYNAQDKLEHFLALLRHLDLVITREAEVVFVDSGSPVVQFSAEQLERLGADFEFTLVRTAARETIQTAWNRALAAARAPYITCLGVDEMLTNSALGLLTDTLDAHPEVDWVTGDTVMTNVDADGMIVNDVMAYTRHGMTPFSPVLDGCYLSFVSAMYRRAIHDRVGLYDPSFRVAGDNEFMHRALPFITPMHVDETLGMFLNYPDDRMSCHPRAELEDLRAKYLFWTTGGLRYLLQGRSEAFIFACLREAMSFRMSYSTSISTDIDVAVRLAALLLEMNPAEALYRTLHDDLCEVQTVYRTLDRWDGNPATLLALTPLPFRLRTLAQKHARLLDMPVYYQQANDVRYHIHANVWEIGDGVY